MELLQQNDQIIDTNEIITSKSSFIEANTKQVSLSHLINDCTIPVFSKDNEVTISHAQFIEKTIQVIKTQLLDPVDKIREPIIRVSHSIKGRIPSAIGKPVKELLEHEKTIYYERMAFMINIPEITKNVNGNILSLSIGGVRAYNQENLYSKKSLEKFKLFIGFQNKVCTNTCVSTDGLANNIRIGSLDDLELSIKSLFESYRMEEQIENLELMANYKLTEKQFAHLIGKARMYQYLDKEAQNNIFQIALNDGQINHVVKDYYTCPNFSRADDGSISLYNLYNLLTEANKSSYIDNFLERGLFAYEFILELCNSLKTKTPNWYINN